MDKVLLRQCLQDRIILLDGATGTELQKKGMPAGVCVEQWVLENPSVLLDLQTAYVDAGSNIIYACTFGANRIKLDEFGLGHKAAEFNKKLAQLSRQAAGSKCLVAGDLSSTGRFVSPFGDLPFEECVDVYKEQVMALIEGGVDLFVIETMIDIQEARAALLAVKESCDLPVYVSMTYDDSQRTLTGTDPVTALITLQSLGADAVGCNCSTGPAQMIEIISLMKPFAKVPLIAKPNAGLPKLIEGNTVFDMGVEEFGGYTEAFVKAGAAILGGCCGTTPEYIRELHKYAKGLKPQPVECKPYSALTSVRKTVFFGAEHPVIVVGERINPTGKKKLQEELKKGLTNEVRRFAAEQEEKGAQILDVNVGMPGIDEKQTMIETVELLSSIVEAPLCLDSSSAEVLEAALRIYPGRALINSISFETHKVDRLLPIVAKYGAMFVLLPLDDSGVPQLAEQRQEIILKVFEKAEKYGYGKNDIVTDGLVMTVSADQEAALETLKLIEWCSKEFGCPTIIGLSNVSFGLPQRSWVNTAFLAMAIGRGLTTVIANPSSDVLVNIKMACDVLTVRDSGSIKYISHFTEQPRVSESEHIQDREKTEMEKIHDCVLKGDKQEIGELIDVAISKGVSPSDIVDTCLIPAINEVGTLFDEKRYFLPQLIRSAEAMKAGFDHIEPLLRMNGGLDGDEGVKVVLATVKGDIHDIGKNIVGLMLKNYGFHVYDMGKDVSAETIVSEANRIGAQVIGLSALMTTTMVEMKEVIQLAKKEGIACKFMIGGAVVNEDYAKEIGADGYSRDAYEAVKLAEKLARTN